MSYLWVQFKNTSPTRPVQVSTKDCNNVDNFIEKIREKFSNLLDSYDSDQIFISLTDGGITLGSDTPLIFTNTVVNPIFFSVIQRNHILNQVKILYETESKPKLTEQDKRLERTCEMAVDHWLWQSSTYEIDDKV